MPNLEFGFVIRKVVQRLKNEHLEYQHDVKGFSAGVGFAFWVPDALQLLQLKSHISHGVSCSILLPFVMEYNIPVNLPKYTRIAELMGEEEERLSLRDKAIKSTDAVRRLSIDVEMPQRMRDVVRF